jgi:hypothetical protein
MQFLFSLRVLHRARYEKYSYNCSFSVLSTSHRQK